MSTDRLAGFDFEAHNAEIQNLWTELNSLQPPKRVPIILGTNSRYFLLNAASNPEGVDFKSYTENPDVMFDVSLQFQRWSRFNLLQDQELGLPAKWTITPDFQNYYEAAWFGCEVQYFPNQVPDTMPAFSEVPERVMEKGIPDPFGGIMARGLEYWEYFRSRAEAETFHERPIDISVPGFGLSTDGPMTVACNLFGPDFVCETMAEDPGRLGVLLDFITEATIVRMTAWRKIGGLPIPQSNFSYADDSVAMISTPMYREHILPHHRRLCDAMADDTPRGIHLCGDATRHFRTLRDELNIRTFDTGFPVDFGALRRELGPGVKIQGGPHVEFLMRSSPAEIREKVRQIFSTGILDGGLFVLREGNNLAPGTPLENTEALYQAGREFGSLER